MEKYRDNVILKYDPVAIGLGESYGHALFCCPKCKNQFTLFVSNNSKPKYCCYCGEYLLEGLDTNTSLDEEEKQKLTEVLIKKLKQDRNSDFWYFYLKQCVKYLDYAYFSLSEILNDVYDTINNDEKSTLNLIASLDYIENDLLIKYFEKLIIAISQNSDKYVRRELDAFLDSRFLSIENNHLIDDLLEDGKKANE